MKLFTLFVLTAFLPYSLPTPTYCIPEQPLTKSFCFNPPTVPDFDLSAYVGKWFQLYTSGSATFVSSNRCVTANYTQQESGSVGVLNCQLPPEIASVECVRGEAARRVGGLPSQLEVSFSPQFPAGPYNVAALLGDAESGYEAAAVYSCVEIQDKLIEGVYIIARSVENRKYVLDGLFKRMKCMGYEINDPFIPAYQEDDCKYFDGEDGFNVVAPFEAVGAPNPPAGAAGAGGPPPFVQ